MKKILLGIGILILLAIAVVLYFFNNDSTNPYETTEKWGRFSGDFKGADAPTKNFGKDFHDCDYTVSKKDIPTFKNASIPFTNKFDGDKSLPLMGSALIDVNNDGVDEFFVGGGLGQEDALFSYVDGKFVNSTFPLPKKSENFSTYGAVSFDLDTDGKTDLFLTTDIGVLWYRNTGEGFEVSNMNVPFNEKSVGASVTFGDVNRDGHADIFVANYIKKDLMEGQTIFKDFNYGATSCIMLNNGDNTFTDKTEALGMNYIHNTFMGIFVDIDNDGWLDLVVAHDTGEVRTYKNEQGKKFTMKPNPTTGKYAYPMGIAVGDYNNDGNIDFFFSNTGSSVPVFMARGDLAEEDVFNKNWILLRNDGNFKFTDVAKETKVADFEFSWGALFQDFNLDGRQDLVVAENYVDFPPHKVFKLPGRFLLQKANGVFAAVEDQANAVNKNYAITPLTSDFNLDGYPDLAFANLAGPAVVRINEGGDANYIAVRLPENVKYMGSRITVTKMDGSIMSDAYVTGEGLGSDQTSTVTFGLGAEKAVKSVSVALPDGTTQEISNPKVNAVNTL